jgi:hypothetical protein
MTPMSPPRPSFLRRLALLLLWLVPATAVAQPELPPISIYAPPHLEHVRSAVAAVSPERIRRVMQLIGVSGGDPITVSIADAQSSLVHDVPEWVAGYALGSAGVVVLIPSRTHRYPYDTLEETYLHELAHIFIDRAAGHRPVPRWFHEGVAVMAGRAWRLEDHGRFTAEMITTRPVDLDTLNFWFRGDAGRVRSAYVIAGNFMRDLTLRSEHPLIAEILQFVQRGEPFDQAFFLATRMTPDRAFDDFWSRYRLTHRIIPILASSVFLWLLITLIALAAFRRRRERDAEKRQEWEEEEEDDYYYEGDVIVGEADESGNDEDELVN